MPAGASSKEWSAWGDGFSDESYRRPKPSVAKRFADQCTVIGQESAEIRFNSQEDRETFTEWCCLPTEQNFCRRDGRLSVLALQEEDTMAGSADRSLRATRKHHSMTLIDEVRLHRRRNLCPPMIYLLDRMVHGERYYLTGNTPHTRAPFTAACPDFGLFARGESRHTG